MGRSELVQCGKCGLNFLHEEGLGKHMKRSQMGLAILTSKFLTCSFLSVQAPKICRVHEPKEQVQPSKYKCDRCADEFESKVFHLLSKIHYITQILNAF